MKLSQIAIGLALLLPLHALYSQSPATTPLPVLEHWIGEPKMHRTDARYDKESAVIIFDKKRWEYMDGKNGEVSLYWTIHRIVRVNDDNGIESFNRIYLGIADNSDIVDIKARTVLRSGKVIEIDKQNIKDLKEKDGNMYKIFAMEGLEKGCELEYYYTFNSHASFFGKEIMQGKYPVLDAKLELLAPERLLFELKSYNCQAKVTDTVMDGKKILTAELEGIPGAEEEKYAAYKSNLQRVEFKLSHNTAINGGNDRLFTWNELAKRVYQNYTSCTDKELRMAGDLVKDHQWARLSGDREKIIAVENWCKKNLAVGEDNHTADAENLEKVIKTHITNEMGISRLYGAIFGKLGIDFQFVLTNDRKDFLIDMTFENWNNAENVLLYFPGTQKFLAPTLLQTRYPWINPYWGASNGLFCKSTTIGNFTTAIGLVKNIPLEDFTETFHNLESSVQFDATTDTLLIDMKQLYGGYAGSLYRADYTLGTAEDQKNMLKELVKFGTNSERIISSEIQNSDFESYSDNKPFIVHARVKSGELVEAAGNKVLVKAGEMIGPQTEMYQEKPRQFPMVLAYPHILERTINFTIPDGYSVKNPGDLNISHSFAENGDTTMSFVSGYTLSGNMLKIHVMELYKRTYYPLSQYEEFKKVINASADFNKVVLVLEKK